jgi:hypothetical protein
MIGGEVDWILLDTPTLSKSSHPTAFDLLTIYSGAALINSGRQAVLNNYYSHTIHYARGTDDDGDDSSTCGAFTQGANRNGKLTCLHLPSSTNIYL